MCICNFIDVSGDVKAMYVYNSAIYVCVCHTKDLGFPWMIALLFTYLRAWSYVQNLVTSIIHLPIFIKNASDINAAKFLLKFSSF